MKTPTKAIPQLENVRVSTYGDYIAVDLMDGERIISTPFYLRLGETINAKWNTPTNENHTPYPMTETFAFKLTKEGLYVKWLDGPMGDNSTWDITDPYTLPDFCFRHALIITTV